MIRHIKIHAKGRWHGHTINEIKHELGPYIEITNKDLNKVLKNNDIVEYKVHVHEPPTTSISKQDIISNNENFLIVNKPSGIPVHPTVNYFNNSVTEMLKPEFGELFPCFRLDRLTSGVLVLAKNKKTASEFSKLEKHKEYLARVKFTDLITAFQNRKEPQPTLHDFLNNASPLILQDDIIVFNGKRMYPMFLKAAENAKPARSIVSFVSSNGELATLKVVPLTGRTHQIRKHLMLNGFPIHNDEIYNDGGKLRELFKTKTLESFNKVWEHAEALRMSKLSGETCDVCGAKLYKPVIASLDLHCVRYAFGGEVYEAEVRFEQT